MIIGFDAKRIFQNFSGLGNYSRNTVISLAKFYPENTYKLFAPKKTELCACPDRVEIITPITWLSAKFKSFWRQYVVTKLLIPNNIAIFHGLSHLLPVGIEKTGIPSVVTIHDLIFLRYPEFYSWIDRQLYTASFKKSCRRATRIIAISEQTKKDLTDFFGIHASKIEVIYQSCDNIFYSRVSEEKKSRIRNKFNLPDQFILTVGTIEQRKNQLSIVQALSAERLDYPLVILGKPTSYARQIEDFVRDSGLQGQVIFIHNASSDELQAFYQMAEMMVYPSFFEGFGLPVLEALASECPVITSNISSLPEAGGDAAIYVHPDNIAEIAQAIKNLYANDKLRNEMVEKGKAHAEKFRDQLVAENIMNLYLRISKGDAAE